jgi:hypothetical protein
MKHSETKLIIIQNYIDYFTSNDDERKLMYENAYQYVKEDHVNELEDLTEVKQLKHRLAMVQDDLKVIRAFLQSEYLTKYFEKQTPMADKCWTHLNNIDIACDLSSNEALNWKPFNKQIDQFESYYMIRCDDPKRPSTILPDKHFELNNLIGLQNYLDICNANKLNYDLVIEEFDKNNEEVTENIYLINKNHLND